MKRPERIYANFTNRSWLFRPNQPRRRSLTQSSNRRMWKSNIMPFSSQEVLRSASELEGRASALTGDAENRFREKPRHEGIPCFTFSLWRCADARFERARRLRWKTLTSRLRTSPVSREGRQD